MGKKYRVDDLILEPSAHPLEAPAGKRDSVSAENEDGPAQDVTELVDPQKQENIIW
jgi:hypothetical protein